MKYATMKNYRNRMRQILLLALLVLGGNMAWGQEPEPWSPSSAGIYRLRSHGNSGNNFGVYDENGEPSGICGIKSASASDSTLAFLEKKTEFSSRITRLSAKKGRV